MPRQQRCVHVYRRDAGNVENPGRQNSSISRHQQDIGIEFFHLAEERPRPNFERLQRRYPMFRCDCSDFARLHSESATAWLVGTRDDSDYAEIGS